MSTTLSYGTPEQAGMDPARIEHVKELARGWVEEGVTPSLVVLAARKGVICLHEAYGVMGPEPDARPLQKDTLFPLASVTKPITAAAAMGLVEDGLLGLNRPVQWYLPEFVGEGKDAVMVHHLLTHTSGLMDEQVLARLEEERGTDSIPPMEATEHPRIHEALCRTYSVPLTYAPGTEMFYCGWGYELLGEIVRRVSSRSLASLVEERISAPLGMRDAYWIVPDTERSRVVRRADDAPFAVFMDRVALLDTPWPCMGLHTTARDLAVFGQMVLNGGAYGDARVLSRPSVAAMSRSQIPGISSRYGDEFFPEASWSFGWSVAGGKKSLAYAETLHSPQAMAHGGGGGTFVWIDPTYDLVGVYFSVQSDSGIPADPCRGTRQAELLMQRSDMFVNAVTASVVD